MKKNIPFTRTWGDDFMWVHEWTRLGGWKTPLPNKGDRIEIPMTSGKTGLYKIKKIDYCGDPPDMFFADVSFIGYKEEEK